MNKIKIIPFLILFSSFFFTNTVVAAPPPDPTYGNTGTYSGNNTVSLPNPLGEEDPDPNRMIGTVISAILGIVGSLALLMFVWGGLQWMFAAGNNERVTKGRETLMWATLGLIVIFASYALVRFIFTSLGVSGTT